MLRASLTIPLALLCASCGDKDFRIALPPAELAMCKGEPLAPDLPAVDWSSVATAQPIQKARDAMMQAYALDLRSAWGDCRAKVDGLAAWRKTAGD